MILLPILAGLAAGAADCAEPVTQAAMTACAARDLERPTKRSTRNGR